MRCLWLVGAVGLAAFCCPGVALADVTEITHEELVVATALRLVVTSDAGSIEVKAGKPGLVRVEARRRAPTVEEARDLKVSVKSVDGVVTVRYDASPHVGSRSVALTVVAPAGSKLELDTAGGSIEVNGFQEGVEARSSGGELHASKVRGRLRLHTDGGAIRLSDVDGTIDATTDGGSITVSGRLRGENRVSTEGGSIAVSVPANNRLRVEGSTEGGAAQNEFGLPVSREDGSSQFSGAIGDGHEGTLKMTTEGGSVSLRRKKSWVKT